MSDSMYAGLWIALIILFPFAMVGVILTECR